MRRGVTSLGSDPGQTPVRPCFRSLLANLANLANEIMLEYKQNFPPCSHPLENQNPS